MQPLQAFSSARPFDSRLRPPVDNRELEIDQRNGMKKYIASDGEGFDTSTACIRRHLEKCIELGRRGGEQDRHEAYRELGTALHTLEDFLAHCGCKHQSALNCLAETAAQPTTSSWLFISSATKMSSAMSVTEFVSERPLANLFLLCKCMKPQRILATARFRQLDMTAL